MLAGQNALYDDPYRSKIMGAGDLNLQQTGIDCGCSAPSQRVARRRDGRTAECFRQYDRSCTFFVFVGVSKPEVQAKDVGCIPGNLAEHGQGVPVADAQPTLRIPEIVVGGKSR